MQRICPVKPILARPSHLPVGVGLVLMSQKFATATRKWMGRRSEAASNACPPPRPRTHARLPTKQTHPHTPPPPHPRPTSPLQAPPVAHSLALMFPRQQL